MHVSHCNPVAVTIPSPPNTELRFVIGLFQRGGIIAGFRLRGQISFFFNSLVLTKGDIKDEEFETIEDEDSLSRVEGFFRDSLIEENLSPSRTTFRRD
jgi:hypothetical protein